MRFQQRRRYSHAQEPQGGYTPVIGVLNPLANLDCHISATNQSHNFNIHSEHPLEAITKMTIMAKRTAFERLVEATFDIKVKQKTTFLPEALLSGNTDVLHEYKKQLQRGRINSYIKLNIRQTEVSREKKKCVSVDHSLSKEAKLQDSLFNTINSRKVFNQNSINEKTIKNPIQVVKINSEFNKINLENDARSLRSFTIENNEKTSVRHSRINDTNNYLKIKIQKNEFHSIYHHSHVQHNTKTKKSVQKSNPFDGIKINYIEVKNNKQNPETSTYVYKSTTTKTVRDKSVGNKVKTEIFDLNFGNSMMQNNRKRNNDLNLTNNFDNVSIPSQVLKHNDNFSEYNGKNSKDIDMGEFNNELYSKNYILNDRKILKKGRRAVYADGFDKREL